MRCHFIITLVGMSFFSSDGSIVKRISSLAEGEEMVLSKNRGKIMLGDVNEMLKKISKAKMEG